MLSPESKVQGNDSQEKIKRIVHSIQDLPTLPVVANRVISLIDNPQAGWSDVSRVIEHDQSLTANVLKLANSAYYGFSREISTIKQAVSLLGFNTISQLVMCASVFDMFKGGKTSVFFNRKEFWKHSIACALASQIIAKKTDYPKSEIAFTGGLLHDIGKVALDKFFPEEMEHAPVIEHHLGIPARSVKKRQEAFQAVQTAVGNIGGHKGELQAVLFRKAGHLLKIVPFGNKPLAELLSDRPARRSGRL